MKVGDYVRTKDGVILKTYNFEDITIEDNIYIGRVVYDKDCCFVYESEIIKSSPEVINLLEIGDYVNGLPIIKIEKNEIVTTLLFLKIKNEDIKSIVTKEQFSQMKYRIGE